MCHRGDINFAHISSSWRLLLVILPMCGLQWANVLEWETGWHRYYPGYSCVSLTHWALGYVAVILIINLETDLGIYIYFEHFQWNCHWLNTRYLINYMWTFVQVILSNNPATVYYKIYHKWYCRDEKPILRKKKNNAFEKKESINLSCTFQ